MPAKTNDKDQKDLIFTKLINSIPTWAWGVVGSIVLPFIVVLSTLQIFGYNGSFQRVIDVHVKRLEASTVSLEASAKQLQTIITTMDRHTDEIKQLQTRVTALEKHQSAVDQQFHKTLRK